MQTIVECGINAPNGMNKQSWEVRVVDNPEFINGLTEIFKKKITVTCETNQKNVYIRFKDDGNGYKP